MQHRTLVIALALIGLLGSWACFVPATLELGFVEAWVDAFTASQFGLGLHIDLVFSDLILFTLAAADRARIGGRGLAATVLSGAILGVCVGLPVYWLSLRRARAASASPQSPSRTIAANAVT